DGKAGLSVGTVKGTLPSTVITTTAAAMETPESDVEGIAPLAEGSAGSIREGATAPPRVEGEAAEVVMATAAAAAGAGAGAAAVRADVEPYPLGSDLIAGDVPAGFGSAGAPAEALSSTYFSSAGGDGVDSFATEAASDGRGGGGGGGGGGASGPSSHAREMDSMDEEQPLGTASHGLPGGETAFLERSSETMGAAPAITVAAAIAREETLAESRDPTLSESSAEAAHAPATAAAAAAAAATVEAAAAKTEASASAGDGAFLDGRSPPVMFAPLVSSFSSSSSGDALSGDLPSLAVSTSAIHATAPDSAVAAVAPGAASAVIRSALPSPSFCGPGHGNVG
ncbi:unnamed protein product, partial [Laminaria digitata]